MEENGMDGTVTAALSPEEKPLIENMISVLQQLLAMQGNEVRAAQEEVTPEVMEQLPGMEEMIEDEENTAQKAVANENGDTKAEDRLSNQTEITDEGLSDLKKTMNTLVSVLGKRKEVKKTKDNSLVKELRILNKTLQSVIKAQQEQEIFNNNIMQAIGIADDIVTKSIENNRPPENKPIQGQDMAVFAKELVSQIFKNLPATRQEGNPDYQHPFNQKKKLGENSVVNKDVSRITDFICRKGVA